MEDPYGEITRTQKEFVRSRSADFDERGWTVDYRNNLFQPLHTDTLNDFIARGEVTPDGRGDRISAPHSSTALAVNTFDWWRGRDLRRLSAAVGISLDRFTGFEQQHGFGFDRPAQLDVEFVESGGTAVGVEVKLREPYGGVSNTFADRYFETPSLWDGLSIMATLARRIRFEVDPPFVTLHAAQLIKHTLGMHHSYGERFTLVYFWHRLPGSVGKAHAGEVERFAELVQPEISFVPVTVGELLDHFEPDSGSQAWFDYMTERYLSRARH
jgi:hypothetical protein